MTLIWISTRSVVTNVISFLAEIMGSVVVEVKSKANTNNTISHKNTKTTKQYFPN